MQQIIQIIFADFESKVKWYKFDNFRRIGESICDELDTLDKIAEECNLKMLSDFVREYIIEDPYEFGIGGKWFPVTDGLKTVDGLLRYFHSSPKERKTLSKSTARKSRKLGTYIKEDLELLWSQLENAVEISETAKFKLIVAQWPQGIPVFARAPMVKYPYQP